MIRPGRPADAAAIAALRDAYLAELDAADAAELATPAWAAWLRRRISAGDVRVAVEGERMVGYIAWQVRRGEEGRRLLDVTDLYVSPDERGLRHGSGLLARALDRARADGLGSIAVSATSGAGAAGALLASFGFAARGGHPERPTGGPERL